MARPTQRQEFGLGSTIRQGIQMLSGKNVDNYTLVFIDPTMDHPRNGEQTMWKPFVTIGRGKNCTIRYTDDYPTVSRQHAYIKSEKGRYYLEAEPNATNPTLINNQPLKGSQELHAGDEIRLSYEGPRLRFLHTPANKTTASMKFTSRLKEFGSQALRPYKQAIVGLLLLLMTLLGFTIWNFYKVSNELKTSKETIEGVSTKIENQIVITNSIDSVTKINSDKIDSFIIKIKGIKPPIIDVPDVKKLPVPPSLRELEGSIYFIYITNVQVGQDKITKPFELDKDLSYRWSGTGFLLDDGRFVTARHVIQPWRFNIKCGGIDSEDLDQQVKTFLNNVEITGGKVEITYVAISPNGDRFTFTNSDVTLDLSKDLLDCGNNDKSEYGIKKCVKYNTDWSYLKFNKRKGKLKDKHQISLVLPKGTQIVGLGYSYGDYLQSNYKLEPLLIEGKVVQSNTTNGMISIAANALAGGSSGGPVMIKMADGSFEVIGIISNRLDQVQFLVPVSEMW